MSGRIVVGMDGSAAAAAAVALAWAASEAGLRGAEVVACSVIEPRQGHYDAVDSAVTPALEESAGGYPTTVLTRHGEPGVELLAACDDAGLLVVGSGGRGRLVVGHWSEIAFAGRVVVGVDGSPDSRAALLVAAQEARLRGATRSVLHAVYWDNIGTELIVPTPEQLRDWGYKLVANALVATGVDGEPAVVIGHPDQVLVHHSESADLLVVGTRGDIPTISLVLGSVSERCVRHARCPVLVRADRHHRDDHSQADSARATT